MPVDEPAEDGERLAAQVVAASIIVSVEEFFALLDGSSSAEPLSEAHVAAFLHAYYELLAVEHVLLLKNINLELEFETAERLGAAATLAECKALCDRGNRVACELVHGILSRYPTKDVEAALDWVIDKDSAMRAVALSLFGRIEAVAVGAIHVDASSTIHAHVLIQSVMEDVRGSREWLFVMAYEHEHWHITKVEPGEAGASGGSVETARSTTVDL